MWEGKETERLVKHFSGKWSKLTFSLLGWSIMWRKLHGRSRPRKGSVTEKSQRRALDMSTHLEPATKNKHIIHNLGDVSNIQCIDSYRKSVTESQLVFWPQVHVEGFFFAHIMFRLHGRVTVLYQKKYKVFLFSDSCALYYYNNACHSSECWSCLLGLSISISICEMLWEKRANARCPELENYSIPLFDVGLWCKLILTLCLFHILIPTTNLLLHFHKCTIAVSCFKGKRSCM